MFNLSGIPPAPRGIPQIEVTFDIDANGILNVTAKDLATSKEAKITITANTKLSKEEIEKLKKESEQFAEADKKKKEDAEIRNEADNLIYAAEKLVKQDLKDKIKPEQEDRVNKSAQELKQAIANNDVNSIKSKTQELKTVLGEISAEAYRAASAAPGAASAAPGAASAAPGAASSEASAGPNSTSDTTTPPPAT